jgi:4-hydroxybenzoate polyprenyltransferase
MNKTSETASDIATGGWLERLSPPAWHPYMQLMRLDRPIGTWLLLLPGWWSIALSAGFWRGLWLFLLFAIGAVVMRGAGCVVNDIIDREFDQQVARTAGRPLASGAVSLGQAALLLAGLLTAGLLILLCLNHSAVILGACSLLLVFPYPLMKRITYWPQAWLGLTFNWGALLGWAAATGGLALAPFLLYAGGFFWTLGYDTIYAHQDKEDDLAIGVKSTALRLGEATPRWLLRFYGVALALFALAGFAAGLKLIFAIGLLLAGGQLAWQIYTLKMDDPADCLAKFRSNRIFGWILLAAILLDRAFAG